MSMPILKFTYREHVVSNDGFLETGRELIND